jgi:hypothetical protein
MAITDIVVSGKLFQDDGDPVEGATVQLLETGTTTVEATYSGGTTAAGLWTLTETSLDTTYDVKIASGSSVRYILWSDEIALKGVDTASLKVRGVEGAAAPIYLFADQADQDIDVWRINAADGGVLTFDNRASGSSDSDLVAHITMTPNATVASSTVAFAGSVTVATNLNPDSADGATIGSTSAEWSDLYLADGAVINLGADQDVTLTHYADNGILLNSTRKIYFEDGSNYDQSIGSAGSGITAIAAPTEIDLTAPTVDINASTAFTVDTAGISLDSSGASNLTTSGGALTITSAAAATWSTGAGVLTIDGDDGITLNTTGSGNLQVNEAILVGADDAGFDVTFYGDTASRYWLWDTSADGVVQRGTLTVGVDDAGHDVKFFGDTASAYILWDTSADKLLTAGGAAIDIVKDKLLIGGTAVTTTAAELNLLDTASANSVVNNKAVIYGSSGELAGTLSTAAQGNVTSLGTLTALTVDNVAINGTTIGHTGDTDLITLGSTIVTVAGEVSMTTLDIGGTNVSSTAAELNILDGVTSTAAELNILDGVTSTAAELNLVDGSSANSVVNSKAVIYGSSGELAGTLSTVAQTNVTSVGALSGGTIASGFGSIVATTIDATTDFTIGNTILTSELLNVATGGITIGTAGSAPSPDGDGVHIWDGTAGSVTANAGIDMLVLETSEGNLGISLLTPNGANQFIAFGAPQGNLDGYVRYSQSAREMAFGAQGAAQAYVDEKGIFVSGGTGIIDRAGGSPTQPTNALNVINGTAPAGTLANGFSIYSASGQMNTMDSAGVRMRLSGGTIDTSSGALTLAPSTGKVNIGVGGATDGTLNVDSGDGNTDFIQVGDSSATTSKYIGIAPGVAFGTDGGFSGIEFGPPSGTGEGYVAFHTHDYGVASDERMRIDKTGGVFIGDTANANMTQGLTINQGAGDDQILTLKSSDVAHGLTSATKRKDVETDDFFTITKLAASGGGVIMQALIEQGLDNVGLSLEVYGATGNTTKTTGANACADFYIADHDGSNSLADIDANGNVFGVKARVGGADVMRFLIDEDGDIYAAQDETAGLQSMDEYDDAQLVRALDHAKDSFGMKGVVKDKWDEFLKYNEQDLIDAEVLGAPLAEGGLLNVTGLQRLHNGAIWQGYTRQMEMQKRIDSLETKLLAIEGAR